MNFFKKNKVLLLQIGLFLITLATATMAGAEWVTNKSVFSDLNKMGWSDFWKGLEYSLPFLGILTVHEFGHYFTARKYKINTTLPFYIPQWFGPLSFSIGTFGALIRLKDKIDSRKIFFDVGIAGPIAGFVVAIGVLFYGFTHLPPKEDIFEIHPEYAQYGSNFENVVYTPEFRRSQDSVTFDRFQSVDSINYPNENGGDGTGWVRQTLPTDVETPTLATGSNLLFRFFENYVVEDKSRIPNKYEMFHYPWLFAGFLALFFTALNLLPIGQLDGGHTIFGLFGSKYHNIISKSAFVLLVFYAGLGIITPHNIRDMLSFELPFYLIGLYLIFGGVSKNIQTKLIYILGVFVAQLIFSYLFPTIQGYMGWLVFALLIGRVLGVNHPKTIEDEPLDLKRKILGWIALAIFVISFSPQPLILQ